ncbi:MAG TPA: ADP-ribosylglycohydrolase family protein, partial [Blastocatellia bacterium]|nr:ADP-ribosylglycohydrolase family protein [Blastocatellia bacterium]
MTDALSRAKQSLEGLSVGDAFGDRYFIRPELLERFIDSRAVPDPPWRFSDDTNMALSVVEVLADRGEIDQDALAESFARRYDMSRGYGPAMNRLFWYCREGGSWRDLVPALFGGQGSYGNGSAMRVAPLGAYFAGDRDKLVEQAALSSRVTHTHPEAVAGAIAVATAAAYAYRLAQAGERPSRPEFLDSILAHLSESEVRSGIRKARDMDAGASVEFAVSELGNGTGISAQDTVPFALWCAGTHLDNYEEAIWLTLSGLGDRDTTCAIAGGIVVMYTGAEGIPAEWLDCREPLPEISGPPKRRAPRRRSPTKR